MGAISGVAFDEAYPERATASIEGVEVPVISLSRLKQDKPASGRHKDLDDLENLP